MTARRILIAVDASEQAEQAFDWYMSTVHRSENELVLLHVPELLDKEKSKTSYLTASAYEEAMKKEQARVKELEEKFQTKILENGVSGKIRTEGSCKPGEVICKIAEEEDVAMIVLGTRCLGKVRRTILGSVSDYVVHHAHCPVIVCRQ